MHLCILLRAANPLTPVKAQQPRLGCGSTKHNLAIRRNLPWGGRLQQYHSVQSNLAVHTGHSAVLD